MYVYIYIYIYIIDSECRPRSLSYHRVPAEFTTNKSHPPQLSRPRYDIFSWAVHTDRPYGALKIFHTGAVIVGMGGDLFVVNSAGTR